MESHIYKYSVVKMASRLEVSVRSYYDYRNGIYQKRSLQRTTNEQVIKESLESFEQIYGSTRISLELSSTTTPLSKTTVMDIFDSKIIGWSFSGDMTDENTSIAALKMALKHRNAHPDGLLFHSDRGVQYTSGKFVKLLKDNKNRRHSSLGNLTIDMLWQKYNSENGIKTPKSKLKNNNNKFPNLLCG